MDKLRSIAKTLIAPGKGILTVDEDIAMLTERFASFNGDNTEENRRRFRELLLTTEDLNKYIGGVLFNDEAIYQKTKNGVSFVQVLMDVGICTGISIDKDFVPLTGGEYTTEGLDRLEERCIQYKKVGIQFAKWCCIYTIGNNSPSYTAMNLNGDVEARFALICQKNGLLPIVEVELNYTGDHDLSKAQDVYEQMLAFTYKALACHNVFLEGSILRMDIVAAGTSSPIKYTTEQNAIATVQAISRRVPPAVLGTI